MLLWTLVGRVLLYPPFCTLRETPLPRNILHESKSTLNRLSHSDEPPPWKEQITLRSVFFGLLLGFVFTIITMKLNLTAGIIPSLSMAATLLGFFVMTTWSRLLERLGFVSKPFTPQVRLLASS